MFDIYEVFHSDGKRYFCAGFEDPLDAEVYVRNHTESTTALRNGWSSLVIVHSDRENGQPERR